MKKVKQRKAFVFLCVIFIFAVSCAAVVFGIDFHVKHSVNERIISKEAAYEITDADSVLVLGCGLKPDGSPSDMLLYRLEVGCDIYKNGKAEKLLLTGDNHDESYNEPKAMKETSLKNKIKKDEMIIDDYGFSTFESISNARDKFNQNKIIIVTQRYHLYRALYIAKSLGIDAYGVEAELPRSPNRIKWFVREILARNKDFIKTAMQKSKIVQAIARSRFSADDVKVTFTGKYALEKDYDTFGWPPKNMNLYRVEWLVENNSNCDLHFLTPKPTDTDTPVTPTSNGWSSEHGIPKNSSDRFYVSYLIAKTVKDEDVIEELKKVESEYTFGINIDKPENTITGAVEW